MTRVVHLTSVHTPNDTRIFHKECATLAAAGYDVVLIAPNATAGVVKGVRIEAAPAVAGRLSRITLGSVRLARQALRARGDIYHFHDSELMPLGIFLRLLGKTVVYDAHESLRADVSTKPYLGRRTARVVAAMVGKVEDLTVRIVSHTVAATPTIASQFPAHKVTVVHNYPDLDELAAPVAATGAPRSGGCYVGGINAERCVPQLYEAITMLRIDDPTFSFDMAGLVDGVTNPANIPGVRYHGVLDRPSVSALFAGATYGVVLVSADPKYIDSLPTKFFEYGAAGLPSIVSRSTRIVAGIATSESTGLVVDESDPQAIAAALRWMQDHPQEATAMGARARELVAARYSWGSEATVLLGLYQGLDRARRR